MSRTNNNNASDKVLYRVRATVSGTMAFSTTVTNPLYDAIKKKYIPPIASGTSLLIAANSIEKIGQSFKISGIYNCNVNGTNNNIKSSTYYVDQPSPWVISILSPIKDLSPVPNLSNELFNVVSKGLEINSW